MTMETPEQPITSKPPEALLWANLVRIPDPALFNAVDFYYHYALQEGILDPPCNPNGIGRVNE